MSSQMHDRDHDGLSVTNHVEDAVGKPVGNASPDTPTNIGPGQGPFLNSFQAYDDLAPELAAQTGFLAIVVIDCIPHIPSCGRKQTG